MPHRPLSTLSHVELLTPRPRRVGRLRSRHPRDDGRRGAGRVDVYLRCWGDYYGYSLVLTAADDAGPRPRRLAHAGAPSSSTSRSPRSRRRARGASGSTSSFGHGRAYRFDGPGGHTEELFWDVEPRGRACPARSRRTRSGRSARASHGIGVRMLDHVTVTAPDVRGERELAPRHPRLPHHGGGRAGAGRAVDLRHCRRQTRSRTTSASIRDFEGEPGRMHHVAFWVETNHDLTQGAKFLIEHGARHRLRARPARHRRAELPVLPRSRSDCATSSTRAATATTCPTGSRRSGASSMGSNNTYRTEIGMPAVHSEHPARRRRPPSGATRRADTRPRPRSRPARLAITRVNLG